VIPALCAIAFGCGPLVTGDPDAGPDGTPDASEAVVDAGFPVTDAGEPEGMPAVPNTVSKAKPDCSNGRRVYVHSGVDGDTVQLSNYVEGHRERVRMVGVDTPESTFEVECWGKNSSDYTKATVVGQWACLTYDPAVTEESNNVDAYGRTLGYLFFGKNAAGEDDYHRFHNAELVYLGHANDFAFTDGAVYESYFRSLERKAYDARRGLWTCPR